MPLPEPRDGEERDAFISRCAGSEVMNREYPENAHRLGVCFSQWRRKHGGRPPERTVR